jgi:hypothetical protein
LTGNIVITVNVKAKSECLSPSPLLLQPRYDMGKSKKRRNHAARFDPLARPTSAMAVDEDAEPREVKKLSAHQQRHMERKRLQAEAALLKQQKRKVSQADKIACKQERREIGKSLKASRAALRDAASHGFQASVASKAADEPAPAPPAAFTGFDLPVPQTSSPGTAIGVWPTQPAGR